MTKPRHLDPLAEKILSSLSERPQASEIVLGGYLALQHYLDYRTTHDIDAWWKTRADPSTEAAIREVMSTVANEDGFELRERRFGETLSFELVRGGKRVFSFQIAVRSISIDPPLQSAWPPVMIETLSDNVGSKMNALVDRGAPRDVTDVKSIVDAGLLSIDQCWNLWLAKNPGESLEAGKQKVHAHLAALEARRPLNSIVDPTQRQRAQGVRDWFKREFLKP